MSVPTKVVLRFRMSLLSSQSIPLQGFFIVFRHTVVIVVHHTKVEGLLKEILSQQDMSEAQSLTRQLKKDFPDIY